MTSPDFVRAAESGGIDWLSSLGATGAGRLGVNLSSVTTRHQRPLSPFMNYRYQYTMVLSFMHRVSGCAMSAGLLLFVYWLASAGASADSHARAQAVFAHPVTRLALIGFSFAFFYHLLNGVRHLVWDTGRGFEKRTARRSGWSVFISAVIVTSLFWILLCTRLGGGVA